MCFLDILYIYLYLYHMNALVSLRSYECDTQWQKKQPGGPQPARQHSVAPAVGSKPLVRVINLCNEPIRLQFRGLMAARCVTARAGLSADRLLAFTCWDEREASGIRLAGKIWKGAFKASAVTTLVWIHSEALRRILHMKQRFTPCKSTFRRFILSVSLKEPLELCTAWHTFHHQTSPGGILSRSDCVAVISSVQSNAACCEMGRGR